MKKFFYYLPIASAMIWLACFVSALCNVDVNYRLLFILASASLIIISAAEWMKVRIIDREIKRSDNE